MSEGTLELAVHCGVAHVLVQHSGKFNAMSRLMWRELRIVFEAIQGNDAVRCVLVRGAGGHFCAGGDISEYPKFRFDPGSLRDFHERDVWVGLRAMLDCDVPVVAQIEGNCIGAGLEMACCCDLRIAGNSARFGAPIARLGFPMAPKEAQLVARELGLSLARQMLLSAAVVEAGPLLATGFLTQVVDDHLVPEVALSVAQGIALLAPQAARMNKRTLRALCEPGPASSAEPGVTTALAAYDYAASAEHVEGIEAFMQKRSPVF
jgi:enoyl-CoA hydratase/carnithine racemase